MKEATLGSCCWSLLLLSFIGMLCAAEAQETIMRRRERDTVTLHTGVTDMQKNSQILWYFGLGIDDLIAQLFNEATQTDIDDRFRGRLELDTRTGSLTIRNLNIGDSGVYRVHKVKGKLPVTEFQLIVYKPVAKPEIRLMSKRLEVTNRELMSKPQTPPLSRSSSSRRQQDTEVQSSSCRVLCLVENDRDVILSWTRGEEILNQTSSPHLSATLYLRLDIERHPETYYCEVRNPVSSEHLHVDSEEHCAPTPGNGSSNRWPVIAISVIGALLALGIAAVAAFCRKKKPSRRAKGRSRTSHISVLYNPVSTEHQSSSIQETTKRSWKGSLTEKFETLTAAVYTGTPPALHNVHR